MKLNLQERLMINKKKIYKEKESAIIQEAKDWHENSGNKSTAFCNNNLQGKRKKM